jgi:diguanylate cyclase (GGDEF)-like protein
MAGRKIKRGLRGKLVFIFIFIGLLPLAIALTTSYFSQKAALTKTMGSAFQGLAKETAGKLGLLVDDLISRSKALAADPVLQRAAERADSAYAAAEDPGPILNRMEDRWTRERSSEEEEIEKSSASGLLRRTKASDEGLYGQVLLTDREGGLIAAAVPPAHFRHADQTWWKASYDGGRGAVFIGDIGWNDELGHYALPVAVPVRSGDKVVGVFLAVYKVDRMFKSVTDVHIGQSDHTMLASSNGDLLFCPIFLIKNHILSRDLIQLIAKPAPGWTVSEVDVHYPGQEAINGFAPVTFNIPSLSALSFAGRQWYIFTSQNPAETYAPLTTLIGWTVFAGLIGVIVLGGLAVLMSRQIVMPVEKLRAAANEIVFRIQSLHQPVSVSRERREERKEDLREKVVSPFGISTGDEIEDLARSFSEIDRTLSRTREELSVTTRRLEEMAITDELTGLYNRHFVWQELKSEFSRTRRFRLDLSCLMIDLDHFKEVNDRYGHPAGDLILKKIASLLSENSREPDTLARFGGEEFIVILPQTDAKGAIVQAERIRMEVERHAFPIEANQSLQLTISIGVASYPDERVKQFEDLVKIADDALYVSKNSGRNRVSQG